MEQARFYRAVIIILLLINAGILAYLFLSRPSMTPHPPQGPPREALAEDLKFSAEQRAAFDKLKHAHHDSMIVLDRAGRDLHRRLFAGLSSGASPDSLANAIARNHREKEMLTWRHFRDVRALCTPAQQRIFDDIIARISDHIIRQGEGGPRHGMPPR